MVYHKCTGDVFIITRSAPFCHGTNTTSPCGSNGHLWVDNNNINFLSNQTTTIILQLLCILQSSVPCELLANVFVCAKASGNPCMVVTHNPCSIDAPMFQIHEQLYACKTIVHRTCTPFSIQTIQQLLNYILRLFHISFL